MQEGSRYLQGREVSAADIALIRDLLATHPEWNRTRLSRELCARWEWRNARGDLKDMACHSLLRKLDAAGIVRLPPSRQPPHLNALRNRHPVNGYQAGNLGSPDPRLPSCCSYLVKNTMIDNTINFEKTLALGVMEPVACLCRHGRQTTDRITLKIALISPYLP